MRIGSLAGPPAYSCLDAIHGVRGSPGPGVAVLSVCTAKIAAAKPAAGEEVGWPKATRIYIVSKILERAVAEASKLPEPEQDAFGAWMLAELESERRWDELFAESPDLLSALAAEAIREDEAGETEPLDPEQL